MTENPYLGFVFRCYSNAHFREHCVSDRTAQIFFDCVAPRPSRRENLRDYLTEPSARPPCQKRCNMRKTMITGTMLTSAPASTMENNTLPPPPP